MYDCSVEEVLNLQQTPQKLLMTQFQSYCRCSTSSLLWALRGTAEILHTAPLSISPTPPDSRRPWSLLPIQQDSAASSVLSSTQWHPNSPCCILQLLWEAPSRCEAQVFLHRRTQPCVILLFSQSLEASVFQAERQAESNRSLGGLWSLICFPC